MPKEFSWSYSKLKNYETCPRRYAEIDLHKNVEQPKSVELERGEDLHSAMEDRVQAAKPLPPQFIYMEPWAERLTRNLDPLQIIQCELKLSTNRDGKPTGYFDKNTWVRVKIDYFRILPNAKDGGDYGHVVDYKTGKMPRVWDGTQLLINAYTIFAHYKQCNKVRVDYLWTEYNDTTHETYTRDKVPQEMQQLLPRVGLMEAAHKTNIFEPKPCGLCENYCPVTTCEHNGKRMGRG